MELGLKGRRAFITGASGGIGSAIARAFAAEGVSLALFGRDVAALDKVVAELKRAHRRLRVTAVRLDFDEPWDVPRAVAEGARALGGVDILVNSAGGAYRGFLGEIPDDAWERYFRVKPFGLMRMTRETVPYLKKSGQARVINLSGTRGREPGGHSTMSGPINFGTLSLTKAMANELGPMGITVNAINPGSTATRRWEELVALTKRRLRATRRVAEQHLLSEVPLGRVIRAEDIADLAVFLASARAGNITGTAINVDGGRTRSI